MIPKEPEALRHISMDVKFLPHWVEGHGKIPSLNIVCNGSSLQMMHALPRQEEISMLEGRVCGLLAETLHGARSSMAGCRQDKCGKTYAIGKEMYGFLFCRHGF